MANEISAWSGSNWNTKPNRVRAWSGSNWNTEAQFVHSWNGSSWTTIWSRSDPTVVNITSVPWIQSYKSGGAQVDESIDAAFRDQDVIVGDWGSTGINDNVHCLIGLKNALDGPMATRPVVKQVVLEVYNVNSAGVPASDLYIGHYNDSGSKPATNARAWPSTQYFDNAVTENAVNRLTITNSTVLANIQSGKGLYLIMATSDPNNRWWGYGTTLDGGRSPGPEAGSQVVHVEVTLDYF